MTHKGHYKPVKKLIAFEVPSVRVRLLIGLCKHQTNKLFTANMIILAFRGSWVPRCPVYRVIPWIADPSLKRKGKKFNASFISSFLYRTIVMGTASIPPPPPLQLLEYHEVWIEVLLELWNDMYAPIRRRVWVTYLFLRRLRKSAKPPSKTPQKMEEECM